MKATFLDNPMWKVKPWNEGSALTECLLRFVIMRIYKTVFPINHAEDVRFQSLLSSYSFMVPKHLDLPVTIPQDIINQCCEELKKMNDYRMPNNKLICAANCCTILVNFLNTVNEEINADILQTSLTYVVLKANAPDLVSNLEFIEDYSEETVFSSQLGYCHTCLSLAVAFLKTMEPKYISMGEEIHAGSLENEWTSIHESNPKFDGLGFMSASSVDVGDSFEKTYKFFNYSPDQIKSEDIPSLLSEYKRLVLVEYGIKKSNSKYNNNL
eukprot:TRINITY_DN6060_c0_g1_i2.p1 TRINITY_DN6060_c0_g1~~TRINITY_DN6060_c0_g1_i2.p1  ORF type:complete len:269 (+),score=37.74 TRINITY_DN6060_c0_g1_i2:82-888(+)